MRVHIHLYDAPPSSADTTPDAAKKRTAKTRDQAPQQRDPFATEAATRPVHAPAVQQRATLAAINAANRRQWGQ